MASGRALWTFDRRVVDGFVNGSSWMTMFGSWLSGLTDRAVVDGLVNGIGNRLQQASYRMRRFQTGLVQNYAMLMLFGVFAFVRLRAAPGVGVLGLVDRVNDSLPRGLLGVTGER